MMTKRTKISSSNRRETARRV